MRIHSDKLVKSDFGLAASNAGFGPDVYYERTEHGSRSRARAFELKIDAEPGTDRHGIKRAFSRNSGGQGAEQGPYKAATWVEWGDFIVELFKIDPNAIIGHYTSAEHFVEDTAKYAPYRPKRENAVEHAARWAESLAPEPVK